MELNHQDFDAVFRERLIRSETPPPSAVWENIALELARKKRRRLVGFGLVGGAAMVGFVVAGWLYLGENWSTYNNDSKKLVISTESPILKSENSVLKNESTISQNETLAAFSSKNETVLTEKSSAKTISENEKSTVFSEKNAPILNQNAAQIFQKKKESTTGVFLEKETDETVFIAEKSTQLIENQTIIISENTETSVFNHFQKINLTQLSAENKSFFVKSQKNTRQNPPFKMTRIKKRKPTCPSFAARGEAFLLEGFVGPSVAFKTLDLNGSDTPNYLKRRLETENRRASWTAGVRAGWLIDGKFLLRAGLQYTAINERFDFYDPNEVDTFISIVQGIRDTNYVYGERFVNSPNRFGMLDLPITIGYEFGRGHLGVDIFGGAAINLLFQKSGKIIDLKDKPTDLRPNFRTNAGLSVLAGVQFFYQTDKNTRIFVEPHYQHVLRSVTKSANPISQKYGVASLAVGFTRLLK
jgi:hypothetical protein